MGILSMLTVQVHSQLPFRLDAKIPYLSISLHEEAMKSHVNSTFIQYTGNNALNPRN